MRKSKFNQDNALVELDLALNGDSQIGSKYTAYVTFHTLQDSNNFANLKDTVNVDVGRLSA